MEQALSGIETQMMWDVSYGKGNGSVELGSGYHPHRGFAAGA